MSAVTPPCCQAHFAKSEHHSSLAFSTPNPWSKPHPSSLAEKPATSELNGLQSTPPKLVTSGVSDTPTCPSAASAMFSPRLDAAVSAGPACGLATAALAPLPPGPADPAAPGWLATLPPNPADPAAPGWLASGALKMVVLLFMAASVRRACARCDVADAPQFAGGSARCQARRTAAGSPRP